MRNRMPSGPEWDWSLVVAVLVAILSAALLTWAPPGFAAEAASASEIAATSRALERAQAAVVGIQVEAVEGARSAATLGQTRQGSGIVIDDDGLVLTIGYLVLEAADVQIGRASCRERVYSSV